MYLSEYCGCIYSAESRYRKWDLVFLAPVSRLYWLCRERQSALLRWNRLDWKIPVCGLRHQPWLREQRIDSTRNAMNVKPEAVQETGGERKENSIF